VSADPENCCLLRSGHGRQGSVVFLLMPPGQQGESKSFPVCFADAQIGQWPHPEAPATVAKLVDQGAISGPTPGHDQFERPGAWAARQVSGHHCGAESGQRCQGVGLGLVIVQGAAGAGESGQPLVQVVFAEHFSPG